MHFGKCAARSVILLAAFAAAVPSAWSAASDSSVPAEIARAARRWRVDLKDVVISVVPLDGARSPKEAAARKPRYALHADRADRPASTAKLVTTLVALEELDDARALLVVGEEGPTLRERGVKPPMPGQGMAQRALADVAEGRVPEVVAEGDRLGQVLVEPERARDGARHLPHLERVNEPRAVVVALGGEKDLRLVREAAEALAMEDAVAVALEAGPQGVRRLVDEPPRARVGEGGVGREALVLGPLQVLSAQDSHRHSQREGGGSRWPPPPSVIAASRGLSYYLATFSAPPLASILAWAAARRAMGTRYGEQDT